MGASRAVNRNLYHPPALRRCAIWASTGLKAPAHGTITKMLLRKRPLTDNGRRRHLTTTETAMLSTMDRPPDTARSTMQRKVWVLTSDPKSTQLVRRALDAESGFQV